MNELLRDPQFIQHLIDLLHELQALRNTKELAENPVGLPDPIEAIKFRMEQQGLTASDLTQYLGSQSKVSEVLNKKRRLSLTMIRKLNKGLGIGADVLIQEYAINGA